MPHLWHAHTTNREGPVLIMQLFGLVDVSVKLVQTPCWLWVLAGVAVMAAPIGILTFGLYKCWVLQAEGSFTFGAYPHRSVRQIYEDAWRATGLHRKVMTLLVDLHDKRYRGDWAKKSDDAKFWGFFLANTGHLWFCFCFPLVKKVFTAVFVNVTLPSVNASMMLVLFWIDAITGLIFRGHRDHVVNFSNSASAVCNCGALLVASLPHIMPPDWVPGWVKGPYMILLTSVATAISALVALAGPLASFGSSGYKALSMVCVCACVCVCERASKRA